MCGSNEELPAVWQIAMEERRNYNTTYQQFSATNCSSGYVVFFCKCNNSVKKKTPVLFWGKPFWGMVGRTISRWPMKSSSFVSWKALIASELKSCKLEGWKTTPWNRRKWWVFYNGDSPFAGPDFSSSHVKLQGCIWLFFFLREHSFLADFFISFASESFRILYKNVHNIMFHQRCGVAVAPSNAIGDDMSQQSNLKFPFFGLHFEIEEFSHSWFSQKGPGLVFQQDWQTPLKTSNNKQLLFFRECNKRISTDSPCTAFCLALLTGDSVPEKPSFFIGFWSLQQQKGHFCAFLI